MLKQPDPYANEVMKEIPETTYYVLDKAELVIRTVQVTGISENYLWVDGKPLNIGHNYYDYFSTVEEVQNAANELADIHIAQVEPYARLKEQAASFSG